MATKEEELAKAKFKLFEEFQRAEALIIRNFEGWDRIKARQYLMSQIIETFSMWNKDGDCLPNYVPLGLNTGFHAKIEVIDEKKIIDKMVKT